MSSKKSELHRFHSLFAAQALIATLWAAQRSYRVFRVPRPKAGNPLYVVVIHG